MSRHTRRDQQYTIWWPTKFQAIAAVHGNGKYHSRKPITHKDPVGGRFHLDAEHSAVWQTLVALANDITKDQANCWHSLGRIAYLAGINESTLTNVMRDLDLVGLVRREKRPRPHTWKTHLFARPLGREEDWKLRDPQVIEHNDEDDDDAPAPEVPQKSEPVTEADPLEGHGPTILHHALKALGDCACLADVDAQKKLARLFPQMAEVAGSPLRLGILFYCIATDESSYATTLRRNMEGVKSPGPYAIKSLNGWLSNYAEAMDIVYDDYCQRKAALEAEEASAVAGEAQSKEQVVATVPSAVDPPHPDPPHPDKGTIELSDKVKQMILAKIEETFDNASCLTSERSRNLLISLLPRMAGIAGSPVRLVALMWCIQEDETPRGNVIRQSLEPKNYNDAIYLLDHLREWLTLYEEPLKVFLATRVPPAKVAPPVEVPAPAKVAPPIDPALLNAPALRKLSAEDHERMLGALGAGLGDLSLLVRSYDGTPLVLEKLVHTSISKRYLLPGETNAQLVL